MRRCLDRVLNMHAAIKTIEDTLLIRRLQTREFAHDGTAAERVAAIQEDISSLERGLRLLEAVRDQKSEVRDQSEISNPQPGSAGTLRPGESEIENAENAQGKAIPAEIVPEAV